MSTPYLIRHATLVNEGKTIKADVAIADGLIKAILPEGSSLPEEYFSWSQVDAKGKVLIPGVIDDQVHFREPGLTHKGDIYTESRAAIAGGITSFMEMPNTIPNALSNILLEEKYQIAAEKSPANYSFYLGASNDNISEVIKVDPAMICGIKVFMGSSTGNMLVDKKQSLQRIFAEAPCLVAVHCEHEPTVQANVTAFMKQFGKDAHASIHPLIRNAEACYRSSAEAVELAEHYNTRLHVLHLSSALEMSLFSNRSPLPEKRITAEVCLHHLWFLDEDYHKKGNLIKWNPAVKSATDREALWKALLDDRLDVIATDHAPHTFDEKSAPYFSCPSGGPMVQHLLPAMLEFYHEGRISLEKIVEKMCHNPAIAFSIENRGFIREGYYADLVLLDLDNPSIVSSDNIMYKCGWSPLEGQYLRSSVTHTFVNGNLVYENGVVYDNHKGMRLKFVR